MIKSILIHEYQHTSQHESDTSQHEPEASPTRVKTNQHKSKSVLDGLTWVNTSPARV